MDTIINNIRDSLTAMHAWEFVAVTLSVAYLLLILRENAWGWVCGFISTAIYTVLFWKVSLLMDSALNVYYMGMAIFGWQQWKTGGRQHSGIRIQRWALRQHVIAATLIVSATLISGYLLSHHSEAAWPYLDSFTTWASVLTTYMVTKKILENWLYWIVIDTVALALYIERDLYFTALLFAFYWVVCVFGAIRWQRDYCQQQELQPQNV